MSEAPTCYCGSTMKLRDGKWGKWWSCPRYPGCTGAVGCHPDTTVPLGKPADKMTRRARKRVHRAFDRLWKDDDGPSRGGAYKWLADQLGLTQDECHVGEFDMEMCKRAAKVAANASPQDVVDYLDGIPA